MSARAARALAHLPQADPALAALALWCTHRDHDGPTATRGQTILYGPEFPVLPLHEQVGLAGHHVLHVALRHSARMGAMAARLGADFDADRFNRAADALVNATILAGGHGLPRPAVTLGDLIPEAVLADWEVETLYHRLPRDGRGGKGGARDLIAEDTGTDGQAAEWRARTVRAMALGRQAGRGIGRTSGPLGDLAHDVTPWEAHLRGLVARAVTDRPRRSHRRPAPGWIAAEALARREGGPVPAFEPGRSRDHRRPRIAVALDSSGSVDDAMLAQAGGQIAGIARRMDAEVHLLAFDDAVYHVQADVADMVGALRALPLRRDGGTAFGDVIARAAALDPSVIVVLTDLDGPFGPAPRVPVLWCVTGPANAPPFGRVLRMDG